jgi:hypothetical protein
MPRPDGILQGTSTAAASAVLSQFVNSFVTLPLLARAKLIKRYNRIFCGLRSRKVNGGDFHEKIFINAVGFRDKHRPRHSGGRRSGYDDTGRRIDHATAGDGQLQQ